MIENKIFNMLGLCQRAGKLVSGSFSCEKGIKSGKTLIVIVAKDASKNTKDDFFSMCNYYQVPIYEFSNKEELGKYIGKGERVVIGINEKNFAKPVEELIKKVEGE